MKKKPIKKKTAKVEAIEPRETPINAPISFAIMLVAADTKHALEIYDDLVASGVNPSRINASIARPTEQSQVARAQSPIAIKGAWERKYNAEFGTLVLRDTTMDALRRAGIDLFNADRETKAQTLYELRASNRLTRKPGISSIFIDGKEYPVRDNGQGESSQAQGEQTPQGIDGEIDLDETV